MILWHENLYMDMVVKKHKRHAMKSVMKAKASCGYVCICLSTNENNLLDIIDGKEMIFPYYKRRKMYVVGLAENKQSAIKLVCRIVEEMMKEGLSKETFFLENSFHE